MGCQFYIQGYHGRFLWESFSSHGLSRTSEYICVKGAPNKRKSKWVQIPWSWKAEWCLACWVKGRSMEDSRSDMAVARPFGLKDFSFYSEQNGKLVESYLQSNMIRLIFFKESLWLLLENRLEGVDKRWWRRLLRGSRHSRWEMFELVWKWWEVEILVCPENLCWVESSLWVWSSGEIVRC